MSRNTHSDETIKLILDESLKLFMEKGYDDTSIQDIINNLGGLSKGAIYHHFKSKEEIFEAVCNRLGEANIAFYSSIRDNKNMTGREKLVEMFSVACGSPCNTSTTMSMVSMITKDPRFFEQQVMSIFTDVAPGYVQPIIEQGLRDGSIQTDYPKELAEVIMTLMNIWVNPMFLQISTSDFRRKLDFFDHILCKLGLDIFSEETKQKYLAQFERFINSK